MREETRELLETSEGVPSVREPLRELAEMDQVTEIETPEDFDILSFEIDSVDDKRIRLNIRGFFMDLDKGKECALVMVNTGLVTTKMKVRSVHINGLSVRMCGFHDKENLTFFV